MYFNATTKFFSGDMSQQDVNTGRHMQSFSFLVFQADGLRTFGILLLHASEWPTPEIHTSILTARTEQSYKSKQDIEEEHGFCTTCCKLIDQQNQYTYGMQQCLT